MLGCKAQKQDKDSFAAAFKEDIVGCFRSTNYNGYCIQHLKQWTSCLPFFFSLIIHANTRTERQTFQNAISTFKTKMQHV